MSLQELKNQIDELNEHLDEGKTVEVAVEHEDESVQLEVFKEDGNSVARKSVLPEVQPEAMTGGAFETAEAEAEAGFFNVDLNEANDISDAQIIEKINEASGANVASELPRVILTRDEAKHIWVLVEKCSYVSDGRKIFAPANYETDLASVPRVFWAIIAPEELSLAAPLFHDLIYRCGGKLPEGQMDPFDGKLFKRRDADDLFKEIMKKAGVPRWKRTAAYLAVRSFASFAWKA